MNKLKLLHDAIARAVKDKPDSVILEGRTLTILTSQPEQVRQWLNQNLCRFHLQANQVIIRQAERPFIWGYDDPNRPPLDLNWWISHEHFDTEGKE